MTTATSMVQATEAAQAAAPVLAVAGPLVVGTPTQDPDHVPLNGPALFAPFTGPPKGLIAIIISPALADTLAAAAASGSDLTPAVRPAVEAAAGALGPVAVGAGEWQPALDALATVVAEGGLLVPLTPRGAGAGETATAVVALAVTGQAFDSGPPESVVDGSSDLAMLFDVEVELTAELGRTRMSVRELLAMAPGAVIELNSYASEPTDLLVNGRLIARGEVLAIDENFGIRVTELLVPGAS
jgi:flagellar motor switch protein FliN/FliY